MDNEELKNTIVRISDWIFDLERLARVKVIRPGEWDYGGPRNLTDKELSECFRILCRGLRHELEVHRLRLNQTLPMQ